MDEIEERDGGDDLDDALLVQEDVCSAHKGHAIVSRCRSIKKHGWCGDNPVVCNGPVCSECERKRGCCASTTQCARCKKRDQKRSRNRLFAFFALHAAGTGGYSYYSQCNGNTSGSYCQ